MRRLSVCWWREKNGAVATTMATALIEGRCRLLVTKFARDGESRGFAGVDVVVGSGGWWLTGSLDIFSRGAELVLGFHRR